MSDFVLHKGKQTLGEFSRNYEAQVATIKYAPGKPTRVLLANGRNGAGVCLGCADTPCATKDVSELAMAAPLNEFPGDPALSVCPTRAISRNDRTGYMAVDGNACIGCGLCVVRCPYGAISLTESGAASVASDDRDGLTKKRPAERGGPRARKSGTIGDFSSNHLRRIPDTVGGLVDSDRNLFVRNLLHEAGMNAGVRRRGDTNMRMDAVGYTRSRRAFLAEIELIGSELESPRALMEDVAVMHARYGFAVADIDALSIIMAFPNVRSEYYRVMLDINFVLGIRCRTLTVGALLAVVWASKAIDGFGGTAFSVAEGGIDLAKSLDIPGLMEPYKGAFRPAK